MKKIILSFLFIAGFAGYVVYRTIGGHAIDMPAASSSDTQTSASKETINIPPTASGNKNPGTSGHQNTGSTSTGGATPPPVASQYKDGTYTGSFEDAFYGNLQVEAIVASGKLADVKFLKYPDSAGNTLEISYRVMPILASEAVKIQDAKVDIISGATQTSEAFQKSLGSALALARN